jgi:hypothetical protein
MTSLALLASWRETHFGHWGFVSDFEVRISCFLHHALCFLADLSCVLRCVMAYNGAKSLVVNRLIYAACGAVLARRLRDRGRWQAEG